MEAWKHASAEARPQGKERGEGGEGREGGEGGDRSSIVDSLSSILDRRSPIVGAPPSLLLARAGPNKLRDRAS